MHHLGWVSGIGDGDGVDAEYDHADDAVLVRDEKDLVAAVAFARFRHLAEKIGDFGGVEASDHDLGVAGFILGIVRAVDGEGDLVEIALQLEAGLGHEALILGRPGCGSLSEVGECPQWLQVGVEDSLALRKQPRRLGSCVFAQKNRAGKQRGYDCNGDYDRSNALALRASHAREAGIVRSERGLGA